MQPEIRKLATRVLDQQIRHLTEYLTAATKLIADPTVGTPARADRDHVLNHAQAKDMQLLWALTSHSCTSDINAAYEHLKGIAVLIAVDDLLPLPALAVAHSVYEAVLNACWLIDAAVSMELRLARWAGRVLFDGQEGPNTLSEFGPSTAAERERTRVIQGRENGKAFLTRAGFELTPKKGARCAETAKVTYLGASSPVSPKLAELVPRFTPNQRELLPVFSGAAHSRGWLTMGLRDNSRMALILMVLLPLLDTSDALAIEVGRYFGLEAEPLMSGTHFHRNALTQ